MLTGKEAYDASRDVYSYARQAGFYGMLMAALRGADSENFERIRAVFPDVVAELEARYNAPGGELTAEREADINAIRRPPLGELANLSATRFGCPDCRGLLTKVGPTGWQCHACGSYGVPEDLGPL